jgi:hypothetical protein
MANISEALKRKIEEVLDDIEVVEDFFISDTADPDVIDITIRGRLKEEAYNKNQADPVSDYDRAMRGISPWASNGSQTKT